MQNLLSTTTYDTFKTGTWHNAATKAFWDACSKIKLNSHGKTLKTVLNNSFGIYKGYLFKKSSDIGCWCYKIRQVELTEISQDALLVTKDALDSLKASLSLLGIDAQVGTMSRDNSYWGLALIVPVAHISDIEAIRAKKLASKADAN